MATFTDRVRSALNAFTRAEEEAYVSQPLASYSNYMGVRPERTRLRVSGERSIISSIYTRMAIDISSVDIRHTRHDDADRYIEDIQSGLNYCFKVEANIDQSAVAFFLDIVLSLFDKGSIAVVPVDTTMDPRVTGGYDIKTMRVGEIVQWRPDRVRVSLYNERVGQRQEIWVPKRNAAIVENPLYSVMNEPNSTLQRLIRKLNLLDTIDEQTSSGKLDLIIQLPYVVKTEARRQQAEDRRKDLEFQLRNSELGIGYTDGTEKITQLNRPVENNLLGQIESLKAQLYSELGLTPTVMDGTADEATMLNYNNRTVVPILHAITQAMARSFITKTGYSQGQRIDFFRDPFKLVPMANIAEMADKFTRNEILTSNEFRQIIGVKPSKDPKADQLVNSNMPQGDTGVSIPGADPNAVPVVQDPSIGGANAPSDTAPLDEVDSAVSAAFSAFGAAPPENAPIDPPSGDLDPDVLLSSLDDLDRSIDEMFSGIEGM